MHFEVKKSTFHNTHRYCENFVLQYMVL